MAVEGRSTNRTTRRRSSLPAAAALPDVPISAHHLFIHQLRAMGRPAGPKQHTGCNALSLHINMTEKYKYYNLISATNYKDNVSRGKRWSRRDPIYLYRGQRKACCIVHILNIKKIKNLIHFFFHLTSLPPFLLPSWT